MKSAQERGVETLKGTLEGVDVVNKEEKLYVKGRNLIYFLFAKLCPTLIVTYHQLIYFKIKCYNCSNSYARYLREQTVH